MIVSSFVLAALLATSPMVSAALHQNAGRLRNTNIFARTDRQSLMFKIEQQRQQINQDIDEEEELLELSDLLGDVGVATAFSLVLDTEMPSDFPSAAPSTSAPPSNGTPTEKPSQSPSTSVRPSVAPSISLSPSMTPSTNPTGTSPTMPPTSGSHSTTPSAHPTDNPTDEPTDRTSAQPTNEPTDEPTDKPSAQPTVEPTDEPTDNPSTQPTVKPTEPTDAPSIAPTVTVTDVPTSIPTPSPTVSKFPSASPTNGPTISVAPSTSPTLSNCGVTPDDRRNQILAQLEAVADPVLIRDITTHQGIATDWLLNQDFRQVCPDDEKLVQRWVIALMYYATGGDDWLQCSAPGSDPCGTENPFVNQGRFLSERSECQWAGIRCNVDGCVTEVEFEENNLVGTIPTEMGLLSELAIWGMERGGLQGSIPTQIGLLSDLIFLDLDFNALTGTLPTELFSLTTLFQLDLNNNQLSGTIGDLGVFTDLEFLQVHGNQFSGTLPDSVGSLSRLGTFTLHETSLSGTVPESICPLVTGNGGLLHSLIADCDPPAGGGNPDIECSCCTDCRES